MHKIVYYYPNGEKVKEEILSKSAIDGCHGMKVKCVLLDGSEKVGYANTYYSFEKGQIVFGAEAASLEYITLETFANLNEETHSFCGDDEHKYDLNREIVPISLIRQIYAVLHSGLRWGGVPTNKFNYKIQ